MNTFTDNPGLKYIAEEIFMYLDFEDLKRCQQVNESWKLTLNNPSFWLRKCIQYGGFKTNKSAWKLVVQDTKHTHLEENLTRHFKEICSPYKGIGHANLSKDYLTKIWQNKLKNEDVSPIFWAAENGHPDVIKILALKITGDLNVPSPDGPGWLHGDTPICVAAKKQHVNVIELLAPMTENPNAPGRNGETPIFAAASNGNAKIVEILAPLTDDPNAPERRGHNPMTRAASNGFTDVIRVLISHTKNPNAPAKFCGGTPIYWAAVYGHTDVIKLLAPLYENPNAPDSSGFTPIFMAAQHGHLDAIKELIPYANDPNFSVHSTPINVAASNGYAEIVKLLVPFKYLF